MKEAKAANKGLTASEVASESKITLDGYKRDVQHSPAQRMVCDLASPFELEHRQTYPMDRTDQFSPII